MGRRGHHCLFAKSYNYMAMQVLDLPSVHGLEVEDVRARVT
jgi:hypothetical protein